MSGTVMKEMTNKSMVGFGILGLPNPLVKVGQRAQLTLIVPTIKLKSPLPLYWKFPS